MGTHNHTTHNFSEQFEFSGKAKTWSLIAILIGVLAIAYGFLLDPHEAHRAERTFANLLLMGYYFTCVCAAGALLAPPAFVGLTSNLRLKVLAGYLIGIVDAQQVF